MHNEILREILADQYDEASVAGMLDIVGMDQVVLGGNDWTLGGAMQKGAQVALSGKTAELAQAIRAGTKGYQVVERAPSNAAKQVIGFVGTTNLAAAGTENVTRTPQTLFKATRFVVSSTIADSFDITNIRIGNRSQLPTADNIPGLAFSERAEAMEIDFETCQPAISIIVGISNVGAAAATFRAALRGVSFS